MAREVGGTAPFVSPALDPAPWYDASVAESSEFMGLYITSLDFATTDVKRSISQRMSGLGGGVIGFEQVAARGVKITARLMASTCPGLEYGRHWVNSQLGADCNGCTLGTLRVRDSCPPADGSNDTRGEWIIYDAALVDGIQRTGNPGFPCCWYDEIQFTLAGESPYLYKRPGTATAPVEVQSNGAIIPPLPAVLDTFVRANTGPPPSASWTGTVYQGEGNTLRVLSNVLDNSVHTLNTEGSAYWNAATFGPDVTVTVVVPTRVNLGEFELYARIVTPNTVTNAGPTLRISFGASAGAGVATILNTKQGGAGSVFLQRTGQTFASGDTIAFVCRGHLLEGWRKPSGGGWTRIISMYDPNAPVVGNVGVGIREQGATQTLGAFGAGTLTNPVYPVDPIIIPVPATSIGITSPIVTLTTTEGQNTTSIGQVAANDVRIQLKQYPNCTETDDFSVNDLATKWYQASNYYTITGGKLKPVATTTVKTINRSYDGTIGNRVFYPGGRVEATVTLGGTITNGAWGTFFASSNAWFGIGAYLVRTSTHGSNLFCLSYDADLTAMLDSVSFTPVASTTYRIILEVLPDGTGSFDVRAYLVDQAAPTIMLTRPLRATFPESLGGTALGPLFVPSIQSIPADTAEAWDSFYAIDYSASPALMDISIPPGTLIIDGSRRVTQFTPTNLSPFGGFTTGDPIDGSAYISTPPETPIGWPDTCAGTGPGCLQIFGGEMPYVGTTVSVALQTRAR